MFKPTQISIVWDAGRGDAADESRAEDAALDVFKKANVNPIEAESEYKRQWLEFEDEDEMTGIALTYINARSAANIAATEGWHNTEGAYVSINCGAD